MPRIHLIRTDGCSGPACYQDAMQIDVVDEAEFKRMQREGYSTLCPECELNMGYRKLERQGKL